MNLLSISRIYYENTFCFIYLSLTLSHYQIANLLLIHNFYRRFITNSLGIWQIYYGNTSFLFTYESRMQYLLRVVTIKSRVYYEFTIFRANSLWIQCLLCEFTIFYANIPWIHYFFFISTMISLPFSEIHYEPTIYFANSLWTHYLSREFTVNRLSISRILYEFTIYSQIYYEFTIFFLNSS